MDAKAIVAAARRAIAQAEAQGVSTLTPASVHELLTQVESAAAAQQDATPEAAQARLEAYKAQLGVWAALT
jgi:hypothetical protein